MENYRLLYYQPSTQAWKQVPVTGEMFSLGRAPENNLALEDEQVSRHHASLRIDARGVWIIDQNSGNGVIVGGQRIAAGKWKLLPLNDNFTIGATTLCVEVVSPTTSPSQAVAPADHPARVTKSNVALPIMTGLLLAAVCICLVGGGLAAWMFLPGLLSVAQSGQPIPLQQAEPTPAPPTVIDSLSASAGGGPVQDDHGVSLEVPPEALEPGQQAYLERASLSQGMQREIEKAYQIEGLVYAVRLQDGQDGIGRVELALPAPSPDSHLAVLVDDRWLGILELPAQDGVFRVSPNLGLAAGTQTYPAQSAGAAQAPNRYLVLTPKEGSSQSPPGGVRLASPVTQTDPDGKSCITEFWTANHCWRNPEGSVYVFWESDVPANLKDTEYLRITDTIKAVAALMSAYQQKGFTAAALSPSNPAYIIIEAGASEPYYSFKTGNVYIPWDVIGGIGDSGNRCTLAHEFFHWIEDEEYRMGVAALSGPKAWWLETSAENGSFLLDSSCIERNLTQYGIVTTSENVLGFQAAPLQWEGGEQARYIHALQLYLSICDGGANCALSEQAWIQAINDGTYPMEGGALTAYQNDAKDLGRFLLGAAPLESRGGAVIPPSALSGNRFGDYLALRTSPRGIWDFGLTMNQFAKAGEQQVKVEAKIAPGGVYPLWVSNGTGTPLGGGGGNTGLPGLLEIQSGPAFWLKQDQAEPVFYPAGTSLKLGPISNLLGIGTARIVAIAPDAEQTLQATLSLADFSGDWVVSADQENVTVVDCEGYAKEEDSGSIGAYLLTIFDGYGTYVKDGDEPTSLNLIWEGTLPEGATGTSEVTVAVDKVTLHYLLDIPEPADSGSNSWLPGLKLGQRLGQEPLQQRNVLLSAWPVWPLLGAAVGLQRLRRKWTRLAQASLLVLVAAMLSGCVGFGFAMWGTIEGTYTFDKLEYVDPQQAAASTPDGADDPTGLIWKLTNGQEVVNVDLTMESETTTLTGETVNETEPCQLTATGSATGMILTDGIITPPDTGN